MNLGLIIAAGEARLARRRFDLRLDIARP